MISVELLYLSLVENPTYHLLPEILSKRLCGDTAEDAVVNDEMECSVSEKKDCMYALCLDSNTSSGNNCPICHTLCKDKNELSTFNERSIGCDGCNVWFHLRHLKLTQRS